MPSLMRIEHCTKSFGTLVANDDIDLDIQAGELHCLFGENGAGKSTLSSCMYGQLQPDAGQFYVKDRPIGFASPRDAIASGIGMVHQHFVLVAEFTVLENIIVGTHHGGWSLDRRRAESKLRGICAEYGLDVKLDAYVWQLTVGEQQWVEILKALYLDAELLILDEPTAVLTPEESERLFAIIEAMLQRGLAVVLITHKLKEVMRSHRVTVLRKGRRIATIRTAETTPEALTEMMIGRPLQTAPQKPAAAGGRVVVQVSHVSLRGSWGERLVEDVSLTVEAGEILGIAGVAGNGQKPLLELLAGIRRPDAGGIAIGDAQLEGASPAAFIAAGVGIVPDDRFKEGLIRTFSIADNLLLGSQRQPAFRDGIFLAPERIAARARQAIKDYDIAAPGIATPVGSLSGGNAQKVVLARELAQARVLLLANQPTRGLDVGVVATVHARLLQKRAEGCAVILASEDLDDLFALSDRIAVMFAGRIMAIVRPAESSLMQVGALMAGHRGAAA
ncbi:MAG: ABC transporter ATP-binding protein [Devosia sp.]|nr:ABC transporter ATP-binding protein [Devosia sp.]